MGKRLNWNAVVNNLNRLKGLSEPNYFEKIEHKAYVDNMQNEYENKIEESENKLDTAYEKYYDVHTELNERWDNLGEISGLLPKLYRNPLNESDPNNITKLLNDNDRHNIDHLEKMSTDITNEVLINQEALFQANEIYDNAMFGSALFSSEKNVGGYYLDEQGNKVTSWDLDNVGGVTEKELELALEGTIRLMTEQHKLAFGDDAIFDDRGIREGFWAGFNKTKRLKQELDITEDVSDMVANGTIGANDPRAKAWADSQEKFFEQGFDDDFDTELYWSKTLEKDQRIYNDNVDSIADWDNADHNGPKEGTEANNPHWEKTEDAAGNEKWKKTEIRDGIDKQNKDIYLTAQRQDAVHYFVDINPENFNQEFVIYSGEEQPELGETLEDGTEYIPILELTPTITYSEAGFSDDFYTSLTKDLRIPVFQDMTMGIDTDNDGINDNVVNASAQTAYFEGKEGKDWAYKFKKEFEFVQQMIEDINNNVAQVSEQDAMRFNDAVDIFWKAFPDHFEGKKKLGINIMSRKDSSRYYYLHDKNTIK